MPTTYDVKTAAFILSVNERTIRKYLKQGKLVGYKVKNKWRVTMKSLFALKNNRRVKI